MDAELNETLQNKSVELLTWVEGAVKTSANFVSEQTPLFIQELLTYNFTISLIWFCLGILGLIITICFSIKMFKISIKEDDCKEGAVCGVFFVTAVISTIFISISVTHTDWIKIKLAPRVYVMEYIKNNLK